MSDKRMILELDGTYSRLHQNEQEMVHANLIPVMFPFVVIPDGWYKFAVITDKEGRYQLPKTIRVHVFPRDGGRVRDAYLIQSEFDVLRFAAILQLTKFEVVKITDFTLMIPRRRV